MRLIEPLPDARLIGSTTPRLYTNSLVPLTPETTLGFEVAQFADEVLDTPLLPWQFDLLKRMLELKPDGTFRYKTVLAILPRQVGKSFLLALLSLYFMFTSERRLILGTAQSLQIARESWVRAVDLAQASEHTRNEIVEVRRTNGEQMLRVSTGSRYQIAASSRSAGRGLSVDVLVMDEVREQRDWDAYNALTPTTTARPNSMIFCISNAGDQESVVLNTLRASALRGGDESLGLFEWSAPDGCALDDEDAWVASNPSLGYLFDESVLRSAMSTMTPAGFRTERLSQQVESLDSAIDLQAWQSSIDPDGSLRDYRDRLVLGLDVALDGTHVALVGVAPAEGNRYRVEVIADWRTPDQARTELPDLLDKLNARKLVWLPGTQAGVLGPEMRSAGATELKGTEVTEACQVFADLVSAGRVVHPGDPLLSSQVSQASKYHVGDGWRFARKGGVGYVNSVYAAAAALYVVRTEPAVKPLPKPLVV